MVMKTRMSASSLKGASTQSSGLTCSWTMIVGLAMLLFFGCLVSVAVSLQAPAVAISSSPVVHSTVEKPQLRSAELVVSEPTRSLEAVDAGASKQCQSVEFQISSTSGIGKVSLKIHHDWAPLGAARFCELVANNYYDDVRFFRVLKNFMAQTGMHGDPQRNKEWRKQSIRDDPVKHSNSRGSVTFAMAGKDTRTTQIFFNTVNNKFLDNQGFAPFASVESGMEVIDALYGKYGEGGRGDGTDGRGPSQGRINQEGNEYLKKVFPHLSYIVTARIV